MHEVIILYCHSSLCGSPVKQGGESPQVVLGFLSDALLKPL